jgi:hypothetical protein
VNPIIEAVIIVAAFVALIVVVLRFVRFCLADLAQAPDVRVLTREAWAIVITFMIPFGGMFYLMYGRGRRRYP